MLGEEASFLSDAVRALAEAGRDCAASSQGLLHHALETRASAEKFVRAAIAAERAQGSSWEDIVRITEQQDRMVYRTFRPCQ
ncbi:hypothetical protein GCM10010329_84220 [Streptomyces spiroverticillatus]|uniref:Uncharacterized protein n=1 Tax=Streptomyces finlayi TaxID=67296 RepID=A0A918X5I5_9ACTN|nr:hypothetical protein GCM10010329_84220 [Streptomyces spiroverticillatus]GHD13696.1 hypothetical protein GCM10010334_72140 [Streptomyces finlayi]